MDPKLNAGYQDLVSQFAGREVRIHFVDEPPEAQSLATYGRTLKAVARTRHRLARSPGFLIAKPEIADRLFHAPKTRTERGRRLWAASRIALTHVLAPYLKNETQAWAEAVMVSLAHCPGKGVATAIRVSRGDAPRLAGIGVDIEPELRTVSRKVLERIRTDDDRFGPLNSLEVWVAKEACAKASPRSLNLSEIALKAYAGSNRLIVQAFAPSIDFRVLLLEVPHYVVALALSYPSHPYAVVSGD